jgi:hypothetical protein
MARDGGRAVTNPDEALERARQSAAEQDYGDTERRAAAPHQPRLESWAVIEPDLRDVRSTRRFGGPLTALKRGLLRLLGQYHAELTAQQTRFNVGVLEELERLERRVQQLEERSR